MPGSFYLGKTKYDDFHPTSVCLKHGTLKCPSSFFVQLAKVFEISIYLHIYYEKVYLCTYSFEECKITKEELPQPLLQRETFLRIARCSFQLIALLKNSVEATSTTCTKSTKIHPYAAPPKLTYGIFCSSTEVLSACM